MPRPTLSVVLCAYNEQAALPAQLAALAGQTRSADEYVLQDDGSTDGTGALLDAFPSDRRIRFRMRTPSGTAAAYQHAALFARSEWLYLASANDVLHPGAFAAWAGAVARWPHARLCVGETTEAPLAWRARTGPLRPAQVGRCLARGGQMHGAGVFVRRDAWLAAGGYDPALEWLADWWLYHRLAFQHGLVYLAAPIAALGPPHYSMGWAEATRMAAVAARLAAHLRDPVNAAVRARLLATPLLDHAHVGRGAVRALLRAEAA